ncbi:Ubiquitin C-terminal hydrolase 12 [Linum perenne]
MAAIHQQPVTRVTTQKFRWKIENVSTLEGLKFYSDTLLVRGHKWKITVFTKEDGFNFQSVCLHFSDSETMTDQRIVPADICLTIVSQLSVKFSVKMTFTYNFRQGKDSPVYKSSVPFLDLDPKGFIVNDTLIVEAEISTEAAANEPKVIEADQPPKDIKSSSTELPSQVNQVDNPAKPNGNTGSPSSPSSVQLACRNLVSELSTMISSHNTSSSDGISCSNPGNSVCILQMQKEKLLRFFNMSLEALCQTKSLDEVENIALKIHDLATDHLEKTVLKDLLSRLAKFKETVPSSLLTIETSNVIDLSATQMTKDLEERLAHKKEQLTSLETEVSRLGEEGLKLDVEIQQLTARKAKIVDHTKSTEIELEKAIEEAAKLLDELKEQHEERKQVGEKRMRAKDNLAQSNASWKLFKENLGW